MRYACLVLFFAGCVPLGKVGSDSDGVSDLDDCDPADAAVGAQTVWYNDADGDGYGNPEGVIWACAAPDGTVEDGTDCDDASADVNPEVVEEPYDGVDNDCYAETLDDDLDGDGFVEADDCDDGDVTTYPGASEVCDDDVINDCGGTTGDATTDCLLNGTESLGNSDAELVAEAAGDAAGASVAGAGDVDGDGTPDLLIGAITNNAGGGGAGSVYVVSGTVRGTLALSEADEAKLIGVGASDEAGCSCSGAGDVDRDGYADILVGACKSAAGGAYAGAAYLVLGPVSGNRNLSGSDATLLGSEGDYAGYSVAEAGDANGDGDVDLLIGAPRYYGDSQAGSVFLVSGTTRDSATLSSDSEAVIIGEDPVDNAGYSVASAGDANGDGIADVLIGAEYQGDGAAGAAYQVLGPLSGTVLLSSYDAKLTGEGDNDLAGYWVASAGDMNDDGYPDILIGATGNDEGGTTAGAAYLVLGPTTGLRNLSTADAKLVGEAEGDNAGQSVAGPGDVDGDGHADLLIGAYCNNPDGVGGDAGAAYLVLGPVSGSLNLSSANAKLAGEVAGDYAGVRVAGVGDVDNDGRADLLVGAEYADSRYGAAYLILGGGY